MALLPFDYALLAVAAVCAVIGLVRGISGCAGLAAGVAAGCFSACPLFAYATVLLNGSGWRWAATAVAVLLVAVLVRKIVGRFVSFCIPQPFNALLGGLAGLALALLLTAVMTLVGFATTGSFAGGFPADRSVLAARVGSWMDACGGSAR